MTTPSDCPRHQKRGGGATKITFDDALVVVEEPSQDLIALDDALEALGKSTNGRARSPDTVTRDWRIAKAWQLRELRGSP
jgi:hypothetical protein